MRSKARVNWKLSAIYAVILLFTAYIAIMYFYLSPDHAPIVKAKMTNPHFSLGNWKMVLYPHILLGVVALVLGPFQLSNRSRTTRAGNKTLHRVLGRVYAASILVNILVVPYLAIFATGGYGSTVAFLLLDLAWLVTTVLGIRKIVQGNVLAHRQWMVRSYAVTWVFVSFRLVATLLALLTHLPLSISFPLGIGVSFIVNMLLSERYLRARQRRQPSRQKFAVKGIV